MLRCAGSCRATADTTKRLTDGFRVIHYEFCTGICDICHWSIASAREVIFCLFNRINQKVVEEFLGFCRGRMVGAVMSRHGDWQLEAAGIGGVWGRDGRVHGCGA